MKKTILFILCFVGLFARERHLIPGLHTADDIEITNEEKSGYFYIAGGMMFPFPVVSVGYRATYGLLASDVSFSGIVPSAHYKQLFALSGSWVKPYVPYIGPQVGIYVLGTKYKILDAGFVTGLQINGKKVSQFLEFGLGMSPLETCGRSTWGIPTLSYGILL